MCPLNDTESVQPASGPQIPANSGLLATSGALYVAITP
jgi:hypothetical protein